MDSEVQLVAHSPGPWHPGLAGRSYDARISENALVVFAEPMHRQDCGLQGDAAVICLVAPPERTTEEDIANAMLIAAAPELLHACELLLRLSLPQDASGMSMVELARRAVRKAKGLD